MESTVTATKVSQIAIKKKALQERYNKGEITLKQLKELDKQISHLIL
jgi:hypothetical protein